MSIAVPRGHRTDRTDVLVLSDQIRAASSRSSTTARGRRRRRAPGRPCRGGVLHLDGIGGDVGGPAPPQRLAALEDRCPLSAALTDQDLDGTACPVVAPVNPDTASGAPAIVAERLTELEEFCLLAGRRPSSTSTGSSER